MVADVGVLCVCGGVRVLIESTLVQCSAVGWGERESERVSESPVWNAARRAMAKVCGSGGH